MQDATYHNDLLSNMQEPYQIINFKTARGSKSQNFKKAKLKTQTDSKIFQQQTMQYG